MKKAKKEPGANARLKLVLWQSGICAAVLLLALLLRFSGGKVFEDLQKSFRAAVSSDGILAELTERPTTANTTAATLPTVSQKP